MRYLLILAFSFFSTIGLAQSEKRFLCDIKDTSEAVELDSSYTVVIADNVAYMKVGTYNISLKVLIIDAQKTTIYLGEDSQSDYAFYSKSGVLSMLSKGSKNAPYNFLCH